MAIGVGDRAPAFCLPRTRSDPDGPGETCLADHLGAPVVLVFYPADDSPVCTRQLRSYSDGLDGFDGVGATVLGISPQSLDSHEAFSAKLGLGFPLLADVDKAVGGSYGVLGPLGFYRRSVFVVDAGGTVRWAHRAMAGLSFRPREELVEAVRAAS